MTSLENPYVVLNVDQKCVLKFIIPISCDLSFFNLITQAPYAGENTRSNITTVCKKISSNLSFKLTDLLKWKGILILKFHLQLLFQNHNCQLVFWFLNAMKTDYNWSQGLGVTDST